MMQQSSRLFTLTQWLAPALAGCALLGVYLATMAPGFTWANSGADGGDLIAAAATGGVAHPTGYPVYLLIAAAFQSLRIGTLAYRTNLLSAFAMTGAALLVFLVVWRALAALSRGARLVGAVVGALAFGLSPLAWSQAVITEVHALHLLFLAALLYLVALWETPTPVHAVTTGLVLGLAMGNHGLSVLMAPAVFLVVSWPRAGATDQVLPVRKHGRWQWRLLVLLAAGMLVGLSTYLILPTRAASHPPVNWGDPVTLDRFLWLVSGQLYRDYLLPLQGSVILQHLGAWAGITLQQFGLAGLVLAVLGATIFLSVSRIYFLTMWMAVVFTAFAMQYDVADWSVYLLPAYLSFSIWLGIALGHLTSLASMRATWVPAAIGAVCIAYLGLRTWTNWSHADLSGNRSAERFGEAIMAAAPAEALLFAQGDRAVFTLWYFEYALHERPDLVIIANDMLPFDWYRANLRHTYPGLAVPASTGLPWMQAIRAANPARQTCYAYHGDVTLYCP